MDPTIVSDMATVAAEVPADIQRTMLMAPVVAGLVRGSVGILRTPLFGRLWYRGPWWARPVVLMMLTGLCAYLDTVALGTAWYLALGSAVTGLGVAVLSHDWQSIWSKARAVQKAKAAGILEPPEMMFEPDDAVSAAPAVETEPAVTDDGQIIPAGEGP